MYQAHQLAASSDKLDGSLRQDCFCVQQGVLLKYL
jgi:hypothetical protein